MNVNYYTAIKEIEEWVSNLQLNTTNLKMNRGIDMIYINRSDPANGEFRLFELDFTTSIPTIKFSYHVAGEFSLSSVILSPEFYKALFSHMNKFGTKTNTWDKIYDDLRIEVLCDILGI